MSTKYPPHRRAGHRMAETGSRLIPTEDEFHAATIDVLEALGLIEYGEREYLSPDTSWRSTQPSTHKPVIRGSHFADKPKQSTAPEALRVLAPRPESNTESNKSTATVKAVSVQPPRQRKTVAEGRASRAKNGVGNTRPTVAPCGTAAGYNRHRRAGEKCQLCLDAHNAASREYAAKKRGARPKLVRPVTAKCGTTGGLRRHYHLGTPICAPCREADRIAAQKRRAAKRAA